MQSKEKDRFLEEVLSQVKFPFDRADIREELEHHIYDRFDYYINQGIDFEEAETMAVSNMGDAKIIGKALNKEHNPLVGWMLGITNVFIVILVIITGYVVVATTFMSLFGLIDIDDIPKEDIVYEVEVDEKVQIDDRVIHFTKLVYDKEGAMNIFYRSYDKRLWGSGWGNNSIGSIYDESGNEYINGGGRASNGIFSNCLTSKRNFPKDAKELVIIYDNGNRYFEVRIPLPEGGSYE